MACAPARLSQALPHRIQPETFSFPAFFETGTARSVNTRPLAISAEAGHPVDLRTHEPMIMGLWRRNLSTTLRHLLREFTEQQFCPRSAVTAFRRTASRKPSRVWVVAWRTHSTFAPLVRQR
jgi:transposase